MVSGRYEGIAGAKKRSVPIYKVDTISIYFSYGKQDVSVTDSAAFLASKLAKHSI